MSFNQLKEFNENEKNQAIQDFNDRLAENQNILEQNKEELRQRVNNLIDPIGAEVLRLSGERLLKKYGLKNYYDAIRKGDTEGFVKQATSDVNNKIQQVVSDKADPYLKSLGLNNEQISNFKNGEFDKLGDTALNTVINKANDVEDNLDVRNALSNTGFKPNEIDSVMESNVGDLLKNKAFQFREKLPSLMDKYRNGLNNQGQAEFAKLTNNEDPTVDNIGDHEAVMDALLKNPELREAQGLVGGGRPADAPFFSVPDLIKKYEWTTPTTGGAEKETGLTDEQREQFEKAEFQADLERASRAQALGEVRPVPEDITGGLPTVDFRQQAGNLTRKEFFRQQGRPDPALSKSDRGGVKLEPRQEPLSNPNVVDGSYSRGSYKIPSKGQQPQAPAPDQPTGGAQSQVEDPFPISEEDLAPLREFRRQFPAPPPKPEQSETISGVQQAGQDISEGLGGLALAKQGRNFFKKIKSRGSSKQDVPKEEEPQEPQAQEPPAIEEPSAEDAEPSIGDEAPPVESKPSTDTETPSQEPPSQEPTQEPAEEPKPTEEDKPVEPTETAEATEDVSEAGKIGEIGDATAENAAKLSADGAGAIFENAGLAEAGSEGFLNPIMDGVGLVTGIAGLLMGSGLFNKKPPAPPKPPAIQDTSVVAGAVGEGQI
jgi:hypothetical protein